MSLKNAHILIISALAANSIATTIQSSQNDPTLTSAILLNALQLMDVNYKYGGVSPTGFDCSGFVQYVFAKSSDAKLPRTAAAQAKYGIEVKRSDLQVGDIVFFNTIGKIKNSHNGIYIGDNKFIHAPRTGKKIHIADMTKPYWTKRFSTARRVTRQYIETQAIQAPKLVKVKNSKKQSQPKEKDEIAKIISSIS